MELADDFVDIIDEFVAILRQDTRDVVYRLLDEHLSVVILHNKVIVEDESLAAVVLQFGGDHIVSHLDLLHQRAWFGLLLARR